MLQFIRAPNFWYVYVRSYQQICTLMTDSLRELRTAVREWECCGDPDQMPHSAASYLGLHSLSLPVTLLGVSRLQWVKMGSSKGKSALGALCAVRSGPSLSANRIIWHDRMYLERNALMRLAHPLDESEFVLIVHFRRLMWPTAVC